MPRIAFVGKGVVWTLALASLASCTLYFDPTPSGSGDDAPTIPPDASELPLCQFYYCEGNTIYQLDPVPVNPDLLGCTDPDYSTRVPIDTCPYGCAYSNIYQGGRSPCVPAPPPVYSCDETGPCSAGQSQACSAPQQCGLVVQTGACACDANGWSCEPACSDGLCSPQAVQQAIAGTWQGTVTTGFEFQPTYTTTLTIGTDGAWSSNNNAFYYGDSGGTPGANIYVQAQTALGAYGFVKLFLASVDGQFTNLRVDANRLRFTFIDSWLSCGRSFHFDLQRMH